ncbi:MAG: P-loop NTPase [Candidatus Hydrogenedens sp.]|nr:P-loop NTPase [Candidatus Hydrogenedens sp.]
MCAVHFRPPEPEPRTRPEIIMVGSGKGGVGKTCFSVNLSVEIARRGWRVVLLDADLSCSNVETLLGFQPHIRLDEFLRAHKATRLDGVLCQTPIENLKLIPGTTGLLDVAHPRYQRKVALIRALRKLDADVVLVDLDAGAHLNTLDFFRMEQTRGITVINPERTSIDNAFKFLRAALFRQIERFYHSPEVGLLLRRNHTLPDFLGCIQQSPAFSDDIRASVAAEIRQIAAAFQPQVVVNKCSTVHEANVAFNILSKYARQHLLIDPEFLGHIFFDQFVTESVNSGVPFIRSKPKMQISSCIVDMANRLGYF